MIQLAPTGQPGSTKVRIELKDKYGSERVVEQDVVVEVLPTPRGC